MAGRYHAWAQISGPWQAKFKVHIQYVFMAGKVHIGHMQKPNVFLIILDTLREDHGHLVWSDLEEFGFRRYEDAISTSSWTTPAHASMFTGHYPSVHGAHATDERKVDEVRLRRRDLLSTYLAGSGYENHLLSANPYISRLFGFRDFHHYYEIMYNPSFKLLRPAEWEEISSLKEECGGSMVKVLKALLKRGRYSLVIRSGMDKVGLSRACDLLYQKFYVKQVYNWPFEKGSKRILRSFRKTMRTYRKERPLFVTMNFMEVHEPYFAEKVMEYNLNLDPSRLRKVITPRVTDRLLEAYRKEIVYTSAKVRELFQLLRESGQFDRSLVIIVSDHGQLFGRKGRIGHGVFLDDECIRVPLFIKYPLGDRTVIEKERSGRYISITKLRGFIQEGIQRGRFDETTLFDDTVFAESFGINIRVDPGNDVERRRKEELDKYRIAVYHKGHKGIFSVPEWKFDSIESPPDLELTRGMEDELKAQIVRFLKTSRAEKHGISTLAKKMKPHP